MTLTNTDRGTMSNLIENNEGNQYYSIVDNDFNAYLLNVDGIYNGHKDVRVLLESSTKEYFVIYMHQEEFFDLKNIYYDNEDGFVGAKGRLKGKYQFYTKSGNFRLVNKESKILESHLLLERINSYNKGKKYKDMLFDISSYSEGELFLIIDENESGKGKGLGVKLGDKFYRLGELSRDSNKNQSNFLSRSIMRDNIDNLFHRIVEQMGMEFNFWYKDNGYYSSIEVRYLDEFKKGEFYTATSEGRRVLYKKYKNKNYPTEYAYILELGDSEEDIKEYYSSQGKEAIYLFRLGENLSEESYKQLMNIVDK